MHFQQDDTVIAYPQPRKASPFAAAITVGGEPVADLQAPLLSFVIVNWNYAQFIGQMLQSIKEQDYPCFECVIVDNGSTDDSLRVIEQHVGSDDRFRVIKLSENLGHLGGSFVGIRAAAGQFVALVDADDVLFPTFASTHIQVHLAMVDSVAVTSSNIVEVNADNSVLVSTYPNFRRYPDETGAALRDEGVVARLPRISSEFYQSTLMRRVSAVPRARRGWTWSPGTSNVMRRSVVDLFLQAGDHPWIRAADNYFLKLCHVVGGTAIIDLPLSSRRIHTSNYFAHMESIPGLRQGAPAFQRTAGQRDVENMQSLLTHAARNYWLLGSHFWTALDNLSGRTPRARHRAYNSDRIVALLEQAAPALLDVAGATVFAWGLRGRLELRNFIRVVRAAYRGRWPAAACLFLLPLPRFPLTPEWQNRLAYLR